MSEQQQQKVTQDSLDLEEYHAGWLYEQVHRPPKKSIFASFGFWLILSGVLHGVAFTALAAYTFASWEPQEKAETIEVDTEMVELKREEAITHREFVNMDETTDAADAASLKNSLTTGVDDVDVMDVDDMDISMNELDTLGEETSRRRKMADLSGDMDLTRDVDTGGRDHKAAMNVVSRHVLEDARRGGVTVVILFDESQSLLRERDLMGKQLDRIFDELKFNMTDRQEGRTKWAVVSFSNGPHMQINATRDVERVQKALSKMPVDETGKENVCKSIQFCARKFGSESPRTMILVVTDEEGDDIGLDEDASRSEQENLRKTIEVCRENDARVYVMGREAMFNDPTVWVSVPNVGHGTLRRGLATCRLETMPSRWHYGLNSTAVPSGFGAYSLSLLADETGGQFMVIDTKPSPYDPELLSEMRPEWTLPENYEQANQENKLRKTIREIVSEVYKDIPGHRNGCDESLHTQINDWDDVREKFEDKIRWCEKAIEDLEEESDELGDIDGSARKRWKANADLLEAQLYKYIAVLYQLDGELEELMEDLEEEDEYDDPAWPEDRRFALAWQIRMTKPDDDAEFHEGGAQRRSLRKARAALTNVAERYAGTPWGERARQELVDLRPMNVRVRIVKRHHDPPDGPKL